MKTRFFLLLLATAVLPGCATSPTPTAQNDTPEAAPMTKAEPAKPQKTAPAPAKPASGTEAKAEPAPVETPEKKAELSGELLFYLLSAEIAGQRGRLDVAVPYYLKAAEVSQDASIAERATRVAVYARDSKHALQAATLWVELQPDHSEAHQVCAALLVQRGEIDAALPHMEWVLNNHQQANGDPYMLITSLLSKEKDKKNAMAAMEKLVARRPDDPKARYAYAHLALLVGQYELAEHSIEDVLKNNPEWTDAQMLRANILGRLGKKKQALKGLEDALDNNPEDVKLRMFYARKLVDEKQYEQAREQFLDVLDYEPELADALFAVGLLYLQTNEPASSIKYFKRLVNAGLRVDEAYYYMGQAEELRKKDKSAIRYYSEVQGGKYYVDANIRIAAILANRGELDAARARLQSIKAPTLDVELRLYMAEGEILRNLEKYQQAWEVYTEALKQMPGNPQLLYARALTLGKLNRIDEGIADLETLVKSDPNNAEALNALGYTLVDQTNRLEEGRKYIEQALKLKPDDPAILDSMGWALYRLGEYDKALEYLTAAFNKLNDPEIAAHLGEVLWVQGKQDKARQIWDEALRQTPTDRLLLNVIERFTQ